MSDNSALTKIRVQKRASSPFIPQDKAPGELKDAVVGLMQLDAALKADILNQCRKPIIDLVRHVNSLYSNKIESNLTPPADVLRAQESPGGENATEDLLEVKRDSAAIK